MDITANDADDVGPEGYGWVPECAIAKIGVELATGDNVKRGLDTGGKDIGCGVASGDG